MSSASTEPKGKTRSKGSSHRTADKKDLDKLVEERHQHWKILKQLVPRIDVKESNLAFLWNDTAGGGIFASQPFQKGEVLLSERPLVLLVKGIDYARSEPTPQVVYESFAEKMPGSWNQIVGQNYSYGPNVEKEQLLRFYQTMENMPNAIAEHLKMQYGRLLVIWQTHAMHFTRHNKRDVCIFSLITSYVNGSHNPNVGIEWQFATGSLVVRACRDIAKGEEILAPWLKKALPSRKRQIDQIYGKDGACHCDECRFLRASKLADLMKQLRDEYEARQNHDEEDRARLIQTVEKSNEVPSRPGAGNVRLLLQILKDDDEVKREPVDGKTGMTPEDIMETSFHCLHIISEDHEKYDPNMKYAL